jgi:hypothetical protein
MRTERLGLGDVEKEEHPGWPLMLSAGAARGRQTALWCRIVPTAWLGDDTSSGGLGGWSSRLCPATASRQRSRRQLNSDKDGVTVVVGGGVHCLRENGGARRAT